MIYVSELSVPPGLSSLPSIVSALLPEVASAVHGDIVALATAELNTSKESYVGGVQLLEFPVSSDQLSKGVNKFASIVLTGSLANMIEHGAPQRDMRDYLLKNKKRNTVPFRHQTPGTVGVAGKPMGMFELRGKSKSVSEQIGRKIHEAAQEINPTISHASTGVVWGKKKHGKEGKITKELTTKLNVLVGKNPTTSTPHQSSIYAGMVRKQKLYAVKDDPTYITFRSISENSPVGSWIVKPIEGKNYFRKAAERVPVLWEKALTSEMAKALGA